MNGSITFTMNRTPIDHDHWFVGCDWEDLQQEHRKRSCWNRLPLDKLEEWIAHVTREIDAGRLKGNDA